MALRLPIAVAAACRRGGRRIDDGVGGDSAGHSELRLCRGAECQDGHAGEKSSDFQAEALRLLRPREELLLGRVERRHEVVPLVAVRADAEVTASRRPALRYPTPI